MASPAVAIGWQFRRRHRLGFIGLTVYFAVLGALKLLVVAAGQPIRLDTPESFGFVVMVPLTATFTYCLSLFSFGLSGDLAARQSMYPPRMFTLPVTSAELAGWPMLYGTAAMALLWTATRLLALWPSNIAVPVVWPALLAASLLAWTQALTWMPYPVIGLRVAVTVLWLATIDAVVLLALRLQASEAFMVAFLAPQVPLAFLVARSAVAKARRGHVPDWTESLRRLGSVAVSRSRRSPTFSSAADAQAWYEWRRHGHSLPVLVGLLLPFELPLLRAARDSLTLTLMLLGGMLVMPVFLASFVGATVGKANPGAGDGFALSPFLATRPVSDSALITAKLRTTIRSTLLSWLLLLIAIPLGLVWSGTSGAVVDRARRLTEMIGAPRVAVLGALGLAGLVAWTWRQLVQRMYLDLSGREWLAKGQVFFKLALLFLLGPAIQLLVDHPPLLGGLWEAVPSILAGLVAVKMLAAGWIALRLHRERLLTNRGLVIGATIWCGAVLGLYAGLAWFTATPYFPRYLLMLVAILFIPLARVSAAPLALARNRHR
jgi:hypothetical protein